MVVFQAVSWDAKDIEGKYTITAFGRTKTGDAISLSFGFQPYFFVRTDDPSELNRKPVASLSVHEFKDLWGFQNSQKRRFVKLNFNSMQELRSTLWKLKKNNARIYESNIDPLLRFFHRSGIQSCGWIDTGDSTLISNTLHSYVYTHKDWKSLKPVQDDTNAPFKILSVDIECYSHDGSFPNASHRENKVFQIGMTMYTLGGTDVQSECLCLGPTEGHTEFTSERDLLSGFSKKLLEWDPDIVTGWNIFGFDLEYLVKRMGVCGVNPENMIWGRNSEDVIQVVEKRLASSALGDNILKFVIMTGRYVFDLMGEIKREHKLDNYKLNDVSYHFIKEEKNDMSPKEIFRRFKEQTGLKEVADYCIQDTMLPMKLMKKLYTIENLIEMAKATWVPLSFLSERGQQIKVYSQLSRKSRELGFLIPTFFDKQIQKPFEGARVLEPECGAYYKPIMCLDFESLYPSIIMAHNLCYSTLVMNPKYLDLPGVEYEKHGNHVFAQGVPSLLPEILKELKMLRKDAKKKMVKGSDMYPVYNGKQLAYKISMNSVYGFTGSSSGILPMPEIASTVTRKGREMIEHTKFHIESQYEGSRVRYGDTDSVMVEFNTRDLDEAWRLGEQASEECSKLFKSPNNLEMENAYLPFILISKKRYFAKKITKNSKGEYEYEDISKGLQDVRRDTCQYVRSTLKKIQHEMLNGSDITSALEVARKAKNELMSGQVPIEQLYLSKQLKTDYKTDNHAHVQVVKKMRERAPGSEPQTGDRVRYVIVCGSKKSKLYEKSEDPVYVTENNIPLDYEYYFKNQMLTPIMNLIGSVIPEDKIFV